MRHFDILHKVQLQLPQSRSEYVQNGLDKFRIHAKKSDADELYQLKRHLCKQMQIERLKEEQNCALTFGHSLKIDLSLWGGTLAANTVPENSIRLDDEANSEK